MLIIFVGNNQSVVVLVIVLCKNTRNHEITQRIVPTFLVSIDANAFTNNSTQLFPDDDFQLDTSTFS